MNDEELPQISLKGFLSDHSSSEHSVSIKTEPSCIYFEDGRDSLELNFDFILTNETENELTIRFIKAALYDSRDRLITFRHLNHNGVGTPGMHTIGKYTITGKETLDLFNPFHRFPKNLPVDHIRFMFTFLNHKTKTEQYAGNIVVSPRLYAQKAVLSLPLKGVLAVIDGHDFYSHHRRFAMSLVRETTNGQFKSNFSRYGFDLTVIGTDGNTREMSPEEHQQNYDFHFSDARKFYTDGATVFAPAGGDVVDVVSNLEDLYDKKFDMDKAILEETVRDLAGNYVVIKHNQGEFSHLFHLKQNSIKVREGQRVERGTPVGEVGFSGAATTYSHLHYQLMDGADFLRDNPLPCKFSNVELLLGSVTREYDELSIDTGDILISR